MVVWCLIVIVMKMCKLKIFSKVCDIFCLIQQSDLNVVFLNKHLEDAENLREFVVVVCGDDVTK